MATQIRESRKFESMLYQSATCKGNIGNWKERHLSAVKYPVRFEEPIVNLIKGWLIYADEHQARYEYRIGDDYVLGDCGKFSLVALLLGALRAHFCLRLANPKA